MRKLDTLLIFLTILAVLGAAVHFGTHHEIRRASGGPSGLPVHGPVTSPYGGRINPNTGDWQFHKGVDLGCAYGTPVKATMSGTVTQEYQNGYGNTVLVRNGAYETIFGHLSRFAHVSGHVNKGTVVGYAGESGDATGVHVHYEIRVNGNPINPL